MISKRLVSLDLGVRLSLISEPHEGKKVCLLSQSQVLSHLASLDTHARRSGGKPEDPRQHFSTLNWRWIHNGRDVVDLLTRKRFISLFSFVGGMVWETGPVC